MLDYTNIEFQERLERVTDLLRNAEGWGDAYDSSTGQTLIQLLVHATDELAYMLERRTTESYLETARLRSSIIARACELGYRFNRAESNGGYLTITLETPAISTITIPKFTEFTYNGSSFFNIDDVVFAVGDTAKNFYVKQGEVESVTGTVDDMGVITIADYETIDNDTLLVSENGLIYEDVDTELEATKRALSYLGADEAYYDIKYSTDGMCIVFGDNIGGKRPTEPVLIQFIRVNLDSDTVNSLGNEFSIPTMETLVDINLNAYEYSVSNTSKIDSGSLPETDISIKRNASMYHKTNGRAVTNSDYDFWMKRITGVDIVDSNTFGEQEINSIIRNINNVYITYLKDDGSKLTTDEYTTVMDFLKTVKTSQAHVILRQAKKLPLKAELKVRKNPALAIADSETYDILYNFLVDWFKFAEGSIGRDIHSSDIIDELHNIKVTRNNRTLPLIDFAKITLEGVYPITKPFLSSSATVRFNSNPYTATNGDQFILVLSNLPCVSTVRSTDAPVDIFTNMRDVIERVTPFKANVYIDGLLLDKFNRFVQVNASVGSTLLIGIDTPYDSPNVLVDSPVIGSSIAEIQLTSSSIFIEHHYYSTPAGRRPAIPLRTGTTVQFTAPTDTNIFVFTRTVINDPATEVLLTVIDAGETFRQTFSSNEITVQFEYENDSYEDATASIAYPRLSDKDVYLQIEARDPFTEFKLLTTSGDLADYIDSTVNVTIPVDDISDYDIKTRLFKQSITIKDINGNIVYVDDGFGKFMNTAGTVIADSSIDYINGTISLPDSLSVGDYFVHYKHDEFDNFYMNSLSAAELIAPKPTLESTDVSLSTITIV
jgi:hypothetical protein